MRGFGRHEDSDVSNSAQTSTPTIYDIDYELTTLAVTRQRFRFTLGRARLQSYQMDRRERLQNFSLSVRRRDNGLRRSNGHYDNRRMSRRRRRVSICSKLNYNIERPRYCNCWLFVRRNYSSMLLQRHVDSLTELIRRDKNRPSVIMWSVANEPRSHLKEAEDYFRQVTIESQRTRDATWINR